MAKVYPVTVHCLVRNEDQWVGYALRSVMPYVQKIIIYDTGSTDDTVKKVEEFKSLNVEFEEKDECGPGRLVELRNEMIEKTQTSWFMLLDGDEVWNSTQLQQYLDFTLAQPKNIMATFLKTRNCVGDVYHYRGEESGRYEIAGMRGHLNIRAYRKLVRWSGKYPLEHCVDSSDKDSLAFFDGFYWHMTHLKRSSVEDVVLGYRRQVFDLGIKTLPAELPEVFAAKIFDRRSKFYETVSWLKQKITS